ncbi:MAG TPA: hypothetical protein VFN53_01680 [Acidobacteriaceae bacterium]|nr:hypothetical protein [Acidobacteriaceae bacterium]
MKSSILFFRFRYWLLALIALVGFWSPWERVRGAHPGTTWLFLAGALARYRILPIAYSSTAVMGAAILFAVLGAILRTWLAVSRGWPIGNRTRELGLWLHILALSILMPPGGALLTVSLATVGAGLAIRSARRDRLEVADPGQPVARATGWWLSAILREIYFWGVALTYAVFAGRYNVTVLEQGVIVSLGLAVIVKGIQQPALRSFS